jgi:hypothetical protein
MIRFHVLLVTIAELMENQHHLERSIPTIWLHISLMIKAELVKF